jgi:hypothetical protein
MESSKETTLPPPPPLRTGQISYPISGSSLSKPPCDGVRPTLYGLHDTGLEPAHDPIGASPVNGVPVCRVVGDRTSTPCRLRGRCCRHLLCLLSRLLRCSRDERPDGSLPAFAWGHVASGATPLPPMTGGPSLVPSSSTRSAIGGPYGTRSLAGALRADQVPPASPNGDGALFPPVVWGAHVTGHITP